MRKLFYIAAAVTLGFSPVDATTPVPKIDTSPRTEEVRNLQARFVEIRISDDPAVVETLQHEAVDLACECFSSDDPIVRSEALRFVHENTITIDLSSIDDCTSGPIEADVNAIVFRSALDRSQLFFLEESEKRRILRECMRKGKLTLWRGTGLHVAACVGGAAWRGVPGLEPDIEYAYNTKFSDRDRSTVPLEKMLAIYTIMKGPGTGWDQQDDAVREILAMGDAGLGLRLEEDEHFRSVVLSLLRDYCSRGRKTTCDELKLGIESAVRSVSTRENGTPVEHINGWWQCALIEYGTFTPRPTPPRDSDQVTDEMIGAAMVRSTCDSWSPNRYPQVDEEPPPN